MAHLVAISMKRAGPVLGSLFEGSHYLGSMSRGQRLRIRGLYRDNIESRSKGFGVPSVGFPRMRILLSGFYMK